MKRSLYLFVNIQIIILLIAADQQLSSAEPLRGHKMNPANIPFVASFARKDYSFIMNRVHFCTGSLITSNLVLTAAHCLDDESYEEMDVVIGAADLTEPRLKYDVHSWTTFENWAAKKDPTRMLNLPCTDLAIVQLRSPVSGVASANITTLRTADLYGKNATIVGWTVGRNGVPRYLNKAPVQILTARNCEQRLHTMTNKVIPLENGRLCSAAEPFTFVTAGDSGGPLLDDNNNILGITTGICPESSFNFTEEIVDRLQYNFHVDLIEEFRQFIDDIKKTRLSGFEFRQVFVQKYPKF